MKWRIWQIFVITLQSVKIGTYREVMCNDPEEWWKIWEGIDLSFQNWHKEFDEFWLEHLKVSKINNLMGCFWPKYIMFKLKKVQKSYILWHYRVMQNLKKNWLVVWKMTWGTWQIFTRGNESLKIGTFNWSFYLK